MVLTCDVTNLHCISLQKWQHILPQACRPNTVSVLQKVLSCFQWDFLCGCTIEGAHIRLTFEVESSVNMRSLQMRLRDQKTWLMSKCVLTAACISYTPDVLDITYICIIIIIYFAIHSYFVNAFSLDITFYINHLVRFVCVCICVFMSCFNNYWTFDPFLQIYSRTEWSSNKLYIYKCVCGCSGAFM